MRELDLFYNTTQLSGTDLDDNRFKAGKLNKRVLNFFQTHSYENYIPFEVYKALGVNTCIKSSVQRSITDLTSLGRLEKLDGQNGRPKVQRPGEWKQPCFAWRIK
jgi:hypothetical protein